MTTEETIIIWIAGLAIGIALLLFLTRWIFRIDKIVKYQEGIIAALFEIAKKQGVPQDRIDGIISSMKH